MTYTTHDLKQGTPDWHAYRLSHFNASEAAAMLGIDPHMSRSELLRLKSGGAPKEADSGQQYRFGKGHEYEAIARPWAEEIIGKELSPITASREVDGLPLSASLDGIDMFDEDEWEHKTLNAELAESLQNGVIPDRYHPQLEQQLLVTGASRALFMASAGDVNTCVSVWYVSNPELRARIITGWKLFAEELKTHQHIEAPARVIANEIERLPSLSVTLIGEVKSSNLVVYRSKALELIDSINLELKTDQDFADAEAMIKFCDKAEGDLDVVKRMALSQTASIDELFKTIDEIQEKMRAKRLSLNSSVKLRKEAIRNEIVREHEDKLKDFVAKHNADLGGQYLVGVRGEFAAAIKGKRTVQSLRDAAGAELTKVKINVERTAQRIKENLEFIGQYADHQQLFVDKAVLALKDPADVREIAAARVSEHDAKVKREAEAEIARKEESDRLAQEAAERAKTTDSVLTATAPHAGTEPARQPVQPPRVAGVAAPVGPTPTFTSSRIKQEQSTREKIDARLNQMQEEELVELLSYIDEVLLAA